MRAGGCRGQIGIALMLGGFMLPLIVSVPPPPYAAPVACLLGVASLAMRATRLAALFLLPVAYVLLLLDARLEDRLAPELERHEVAVAGRIESMPLPRGEAMEFLFEPGRRVGASRWPSTIRVRWYDPPSELRAGDVWRLNLRLMPPRARINFHGPDTERWYFSRGIGALATVTGSAQHLLDRDSDPSVERVRQALRSRIMRDLGEHPARGIILALGLADRSDMRASDWRSLALTGTAHLLAISGLHIGLAALFGFWAGRLLGALLPAAARLRWHLSCAWGVALICAAGYAALAGFGTSTQRALIMLLVLCGAHVSRRRTHPSRPVLLALAGVLCVDPLAPLRAGFWLSFAAVGTLVLIFAPRHGRITRVRSMVLAQAGITLVTMPFTMAWFQQSTIIGLGANLVAIPWVSFLVVPLVLLGAFLYLLGTPLAAPVMQLAAAAAQLLASLLGWLSARAAAVSWSTFAPGISVISLALLGSLVLLLPRGVRLRRLGPFLLLPLLLPVFQPVQPEFEPGEFRLDVLDVGQGFAALVTSRSHLLLYDSGPGLPGTWDLVGSAIVPAVTGTGLRGPDMMLVSHGDLDHAGGLATLRERFAAARVHANLGSGSVGCNENLRWQWDDIEFRVLHPSTGLPYLGNASSCVLSITSRHGSVLLTGDIDASVEARLLAQGIEPHAVVVVPHHGSRTSSTAGFAQVLDPEWALVSAGAGNRFGFPHAEVSDRYTRRGAIVQSTSECGGLRLKLASGGRIEARTARHERRSLWRWPAAPGCS